MGAHLRETDSKADKQTLAFKTNTHNRYTMTAHQIAYSMTQQGVPMGMTEGVQARFEVDDAHVGFMIGKKGGNVKRIREQTNTQILIQDPDERSEGRKWFLVRALFKKNLAAALAELAMLGNRAPVKNRGYGVPTQEEYEPAMVKCSYLLVHPDHVGIIVGKRGANVTRISREHGAFIYIQEATVGTGGMPWFQIKGLYERNITDAYFALVQEAQRAEQTVPRFTMAPQFSGPAPRELGADAYPPAPEDEGDFPPYKRVPRPMPVMPSEHVEMARRMDAVMDFVMNHKDGAKYPMEDPFGAAFCLSHGISAEDCRKIREAAKAQVEAEEGW